MLKLEQCLNLSSAAYMEVLQLFYFVNRTPYS